MEAKTHISILIVDDCQAKVNKISKVLEECNTGGLKVEVASDQINALNYLAKEKFDLLILDMQLPNREGDSELDKLGGVNLLTELYQCDDEYIMPTNILALTEYDELQTAIRDEFSEVASLKFESESDKWNNSLKRKILAIEKSKQKSRRIIYCEGRNAELLNSMDLQNIEFRGLEDSRAIYLSAKNEPINDALRDKDFLTTKEIEKLQKEYPNYFVLKYYCFENYLYHPDNLLEAIEGFDIGEYIDNILTQKNDKQFDIIQDYKLSRNGYTELQDQGKRFKDNAPEDEIVELLRSSEFEDCYVLLDMAGKKDKQHKKSINKQLLLSLIHI